MSGFADRFCSTNKGPVAPHEEIGHGPLTATHRQVSATTDCGHPVAAEVGCSSNYPQCGNIGQHGRFTFNAIAGTSYFIRVANDSGGVGDYQLVLCEGTRRTPRPFHRRSAKVHQGQDGLGRTIPVELDPSPVRLQPFDAPTR